MFFFTLAGVALVIFGFYNLFIRKIDAYSLEDRESETFWGYAYVRYIHPPGMLGIGIMLSVVGISTYFFGNSADVIMSWVLFSFGVTFLVVGLVVYFSKHVAEFFWSIVPRNDKNDFDARWMFWSFLHIAFICFFGFFLFYPPFLGIG